MKEASRAVALHHQDRLLSIENMVLGWFVHAMLEELPAEFQGCQCMPQCSHNLGSQIGLIGCIGHVLGEERRFWTDKCTPHSEQAGQANG